MKKNQLVVITGASSGLGREMAKSFARRGKSLALIARRTGPLESLARECEKLSSPSADIFTIDVNSHQLVRETLQKLENDFGIDYFIANAGVNDTYPIDQDSTKMAQNTFAVNTIAVIDQIEFLKSIWLKKDQKNRNKVIVGVTSISAVRGLPESGIYSASKAATAVYLESISIECRPKGIRIVNFAPGFMKTEMTEGATYSMPFILSAQKAAELCVSDVLKGKDFIIYAWPFKLIVYFLQVLPNWAYRLWASVFMKLRGGRSFSSET